MKDFVEQIRTVRKMGPLKDLLEKFPIFGEMTEQLNPDEKELDEDRGDVRLDDRGRAAATRR